MFSKNNLEAAIKKVGSSNMKVCRATKMAESTWHAKMSGRREWKLGEMDAINAYLSDRGWTGNPSEIWFYGKV